MKNGVLYQSFEWHSPGDGSFYRSLAAEAQALRDSGFTAVWLPPAYKGTSVFDVGYGVYDLYDLGEFDQKGTVRTKYGTRQELLDLIAALHSCQIQVYADVVLNHMGGADGTEAFMAVKVNPDNRNEEIEEPREIEGWTRFEFPDRAGAYSDFTWSHFHFSGVDYDNRKGEKAIFRILGENKGWNWGVSDEHGNYDYLMFADIDHAHPDVRESLLQWTDWFIQETGVDGFRLDAVKHIDQAFMHDLHDLFDVGLHFNFYEASLKGADYDLRTLFDQTLVREYPTLAVTFVDNHDSQPDQALQSWIEPWFKPIAYALILLRKEGYPCVFAGDYQGIGGEHPIPGQREVINRLLDLRRNFAYGDQVDVFDYPDLIGWVRQGDASHPFKTVVVISSTEAGSLRLSVGESEAGETYTERMGFELGEVVIEADGTAEFPSTAGNVCVWINRKA
jgi:alpha-amylase